MASIKKLKKEITSLCEEVISNCYLAALFQGEEAQDALKEIIGEAAELHNNFRSAVYNCPKDTCKKDYFAGITDEVINKSEELFGKISNVCKK